MIVLSVDQASSSGIALNEDGKLLYSGVIKAKGNDYHHKIAFLRDELMALIVKYNPDIVTLEDTQARNNASVHAKLSGLMYVLANACINMEVGYRILHPSTWRKELGLKSRPTKEAKEASIAFANEKFDLGLGAKDDDHADAVCMSVAMQSILKKEQVNE